MSMRLSSNKFARSILPLACDIPTTKSHNSMRLFTFLSRTPPFKCPPNTRALSEKFYRKRRNSTSIAAKSRCIPTHGSEYGHHKSELKIEPTRSGEPIVHAIFEKDTSTWQYIIADPASSHAVIIDPVLDYDRATQTISTSSADGLLQTIKEEDYSILMILETHVHADHITAASYLQTMLAKCQSVQPLIGIGKRIGQIQKYFGQQYGIAEAEYLDCFGKYFEDDEVFKIGDLEASVIHLPGHTPDHIGYKIGENVFCGDSIFNADIGTARCDFPGGSASDLFQSGKKLLDMCDRVRIWTGHDYPPAGRDGPKPWMSVQEHRQHNKHLMDGTTSEIYVALRQERDAMMMEPKLLHPSLQINIRGGRLPDLSPSGHRMLRLPIKVKGEEWKVQI